MPSAAKSTNLTQSLPKLEGFNKTLTHLLNADKTSYVYFQKPKLHIQFSTIYNLPSFIHTQVFP